MGVTLTVQNATISGVAVSLVSVTATATGHTFTNDGRTILRIDSTATASRTATVQSTTACNQGSYHDVTITVATGASVEAGVFDPARFGSTVTFDVSGAGLTAAAIRK